MSTHNQLYYPPGGILIWFILILELFTFTGAIIAFGYQHASNQMEFEWSQNKLNDLLATINTLVLISSGYFVALAVQKMKTQWKIARVYTSLALILGLLFIVLKSIEYADKYATGYAAGYNTFFMFYWLITGFHFVHVLLGIVLLAAMVRMLKKQGLSDQQEYDCHTIAVYWHMCDLIWIFIYPLLYLT